MLFDMHFHAEFVDDVELLAKDFCVHGITALCATTMPASYLRLKQTLNNFAHMPVALGAHPWWIADGRLTKPDLDLFVELSTTERYIGEIGLDFLKDNHALQVEWFVRIVQSLSQNTLTDSPRVLTMHAVKSTNTVLDILQGHRLLESSIPILHWFSGSTPEFARAQNLGCFFSVNPMCLQTKRWKEYLKLVNPEQLLLETDMPPSKQGTWSVDEETTMLTKTLGLIRHIRPDIQPETLSENARRILQ